MQDEIRVNPEGDVVPKTASLSLWRITRDSANVDDDENAGFVIAAETEDRVREIASKRASDEGPAVWLASMTAFVTRIGEAAPGIPEGIILIDFNAR